MSGGTINTRGKSPLTTPLNSRVIILITFRGEKVDKFEHDSNNRVNDVYPYRRIRQVLIYSFDFHD